MKLSKTPLKDLYVCDSDAIEDERGAFSRFFCRHELEEVIVQKQVVQVNYSSTSKRGAIRGLHFQLPPAMETKMVRCIQGEVFDVAVDIRAKSPTFLKWHGQILSAKMNNMMIIPEGFAHGFQTLSSDVKMLYLHTEFYSPENERGIRYDDPSLNVKWPIACTELSNRDKAHTLLPADFTGIIK